jgi:hypothetical protein
VSEQTWLIEKCLELLSDNKNYIFIDPLTAIQKLDKKCTEMEVIALLAEAHLPNGKQIGNYLRHLITPPKEKHNVPLFYGIPKIHKEPVKMRPIIPCHSTVQNPAAKYISKMLKPIIQSVPSIIHGTKDLAIKQNSIINTPEILSYHWRHHSILPQYTNRKMYRYYMQILYGTLPQWSNTYR